MVECPHFISHGCIQSEGAFTDIIRVYQGKDGPWSGCIKETMVHTDGFRYPLRSILAQRQVRLMIFPASLPSTSLWVSIIRNGGYSKSSYEHLTEDSIALYVVPTHVCRIHLENRLASQTYLSTTLSTPRKTREFLSSSS